MAEAASLPVLLRQLRLPTMAGCYAEIAERAEQQGWSLGSTLATLCEYELAERQRRRLQRHLKESRLPAAKTLAAFDFDAVGGVKHQQLARLADQAEWVEAAHNLLLFGPSGVGKSHLAAAIGHALIDHPLGQPGQEAKTSL